MDRISSGRTRSKTYLGQLLHIRLNDVKAYFGNTQERIRATMTWSNGNQVGVTYNDAGMLLSFSSGGNDYTQQVIKTYTACNYGGQGRPWMLCSCGGRTNKLYLQGLRFVCRKCTGLPYGSQSLAPEARQVHTIRRLQKKLDKTGVYEIGDFPYRPKGMHSGTYDKITDDLEQAIQTREAVMDTRLFKVLRRFGGAEGLLAGIEPAKKEKESKLWRG